VLDSGDAGGKGAAVGGAALGVTPGAGDPGKSIVVHLVDGTYELFRHFYGLRAFNKGKDIPFGAAIGVLNTVVQMIETGATHIGVATDHVIESFRNDLWPGYKTGDGLEPALLAQFHPLEDALVAMGVQTWAMVELEADDALASAAYLAARDKKVEKVCIWTPDKDLGQCVVGDRVVQIERRTLKVRNEAAIEEKFGVGPSLIPDFLGLVGDAADGYPGIPGIGKSTAARLLKKHGPIESWPADVLGEKRELALLFKKLATLRTDALLFKSVGELEWTGPTKGFAAVAARMDASRLLERTTTASHGLHGQTRTGRRA
jgi:5'-3' exonuclease